MASRIAPGTIGMPVASASPSAVNAACQGLRSRFRKAMRKAGDASRARPMRSKSDA